MLELNQEQKAAALIRQRADAYEPGAHQLFDFLQFSVEQQIKSRGAFFWRTKIFQMVNLTTTKRIEEKGISRS